MRKRPQEIGCGVSHTSFWVVRLADKDAIPKSSFCQLLLAIDTGS